MFEVYCMILIIYINVYMFREFFAFYSLSDKVNLLTDFL